VSAAAKVKILCNIVSYSARVPRARLSGFALIWPKLAMYDTRRMGVASSRALLEFVLIDLDLAMTFLNVADSSTIAETAQRNRHYARRATMQSFTGYPNWS
jgi:hypothetical protein